MLFWQYSGKGAPVDVYVKKKMKVIFALVFCVAGLMIGSSLSLGQAKPDPVQADLTMRIFPEMYYQQVNPGQDNIFYLEVTNNSSETITDIALSSQIPDKWTIEFQPAQIDALDSGATQTINVNVRPAKNASNNEYSITLFAHANNAQGITGTTLRVENATSTWFWVGIVATVIMIAGFVFIYRRFGRD